MVTVPGNWIKTVLESEPRRDTTRNRVPAEPHGGLREIRGSRIESPGWIRFTALNQAGGPQAVRSSLVARMSQLSTTRQKCPSDVRRAIGSSPGPGQVSWRIDPPQGRPAELSRLAWISSSSGLHRSDSDGQAAIDRDHLAGEVARSGAGQVADQVGDVLGRPEPSATGYAPSPRS